MSDAVDSELSGCSRDRWRAAYWVLFAGVVAVLVAGCASGAGGHRPSADHVSGSGGSGAVDPQVLQDVIEDAFPVPGRGSLREMRVENFITDWSTRKCGGTHMVPLDSTESRFQQDTTPDLELIRKKGLREPVTKTWKGTRPSCDGASKGNLNDRLPALQKVMNGPLGRWEDDVILSAEQEPGLVALKKPFAQCLRGDPYAEQLGIKVSSDDPPTSFLLQSDDADKRMRGSSPDDQRLGKLYARCGKAYFGELRRLLLAKRPAMVQRNRELLEKFARQLTALGYVP